MSYDFKENLKNSIPSVEETVRMLRAQGIDAYDIGGRGDGVDRADVLVKHETLMEVKEVSRCFTGPHDWPFYDDVIIDCKATYDAKEEEPYKYICWSYDWKAYLLIDVKKTRDEWYEKMKRDHLVRPTPENPNPEKLFYLVSKKLVTFHLHTPIGIKEPKP